MVPDNAAVATATEELARYVVALEAAISDDARSGGGVAVDTPALGVLLALDLFGPLRPNAISQLLAMHSGTTTKRIDRLEAAALVSRSRRPLPQDRRSVVVQIEDGGRHEIARVERVAAATAAHLLAALRPLMGEQPGPPPGSPPPGPAPVLAGLFRFVSMVDRTVIRAIGPHQVLHPADPRPLLLLADLHHHGPRAPGALPALIDRSRTATHRLVRRMVDDGLLASGPSPSPGQRAVVSVTPKGRRVFRAVVTAMEEDLPAMQPAMADLAAALTAGRRAEPGEAAPTAPPVPSRS